jgi:hypothetical protein
MVSYKIIFNMKKTIIFTLFFIFSIQIFAQINGKTSSFVLPIELNQAKNNFVNNSIPINVKRTKNKEIIYFGHGIGKYFLVGAQFANVSDGGYFSDKSSFGEYYQKINQNSFGVNATLLIPNKSKFLPFISNDFLKDNIVFRQNFDTGKDETLKFSNSTYGSALGSYFFHNPNVATDFRIFYLRQKSSTSSKEYFDQIGLKLSTISFFQDNQINFVKETSDKPFISKGRIAANGYLFYVFLIHNPHIIGYHRYNSLTFNLNYQQILSDNIGIGLKMTNESKNTNINLYGSYYFKVRPNFYINPTFGALYNHQVNPQGKINNYYSHLGLNFEYFINKNISYQIKTTYYEKLNVNKTTSEKSRIFDFTSGFNYYLK